MGESRFMRRRNSLLASYNGSAWVTNGSAGGLFQISSDGNGYYYTHTAAGAHSLGRITLGSIEFADGVCSPAALSASPQKLIGISLEGSVG
jgi:hypothetical protein